MSSDSPRSYAPAPASTPAVRAVMAVAATQHEAERQVLAEAPRLQVLRSREINLEGVIAMLGKPLDKHWAVVVAPHDYVEPANEASDPAPEERCERDAQIFYLRLAVDPLRAASGVVEEFPCPACGETVHLELSVLSSPPRAVSCQCEHCRTPLTRRAGSLQWVLLPSNATAPVRCIFDGIIDNCHEHAIPLWVSKRLGVRAMLPVESAFVHPGSVRRRHPISFASYRTQGFCCGCNAHFGVLEDEVSPTLEAMARGHEVVLDAGVQQRLALWANKTAFALRVAENQRDLPFARDQLVAVRAGEVAPRTWIGFFSWNGGPVVGTGTGRIISRSDQQVYFAILMFAKFGFCVTAVTEPLTRSQQIGADVDRVAQIWPPRYTSLTWPWPPLDDRATERLMNVIPVTARA